MTDSIRVHMLMDPDLAGQVDRWRVVQTPILNRTQAIHELVRCGLGVDGLVAPAESVEIRRDPPKTAVNRRKTAKPASTVAPAVQRLVDAPDKDGAVAAFLETPATAPHVEVQIGPTAYAPGSRLKKPKGAR